MTTIIEKIIKQAESIRNKLHKIQPGEPYEISNAATSGDCVWQGDLGVEIVDSIPKNYELIDPITEQDKQLVPGNTIGSKHCLQSIDGVKMYRPKGWGENYEGLDGPVLKLNRTNTIEHPKHGNVTIPEGFVVACRYQREFDLEQKRERRNRD